MKTTIQQVYYVILFLLSLVVIIGLGFFVIRYAQEPGTSPFELATVVGLLGGFALAGGFVGQKDYAVQYDLRRIGALYLVSTILLVFYGLYIPLDILGADSLKTLIKIFMPITYWVGALFFLGATMWFLWIVPKFFRNTTN